MTHLEPIDWSSTTLSEVIAFLRPYLREGSEITTGPALVSQALYMHAWPGVEVRFTHHAVNTGVLMLEYQGECLNLAGHDLDEVKSRYKIDASIPPISQWRRKELDGDEDRRYRNSVAGANRTDFERIQKGLNEFAVSLRARAIAEQTAPVQKRGATPRL